MIVSMRSVAVAISRRLSVPLAFSICASMPIRCGIPCCVSSWVRRWSTKCSWAASSTFGIMMQSRFWPAPPTTSTMSPRHHWVVTPFTRTTRVLPE